MNLVFVDAWQKTRMRFADTWQGWAIVCLAFVIGAAIHTAYKDWSTALDDAVVSALTGLGGTVGVMVLHFVWKAIGAPYRLWVANQIAFENAENEESIDAINLELERHIEKGRELLAEFAFVSNLPDVEGWRAIAEAIAEKCGRDEARLVRTLYPKSGDAGLLARHAAGIGEKEILEGLIEKLRSILIRRSKLSLR